LPLHASAHLSLSTLINMGHAMSVDTPLAHHGNLQSATVLYNIATLNAPRITTHKPRILLVPPARSPRSILCNAKRALIHSHPPIPSLGLSDIKSGIVLHRLVPFSTHAKRCWILKFPTCHRLSNNDWQEGAARYIVAPARHPFGDSRLCRASMLELTIYKSSLTPNHVGRLR